MKKLLKFMKETFTEAVRVTEAAALSASLWIGLVMESR